MATLTDAHRKAALAHLNDICPDTFDEGEFGPWSFSSLERKDDTWTLAFTNSNGSDAVKFKFAADCVDAKGGVSQAWFEQINEAILAWESENDPGMDE